VAELSEDSQMPSAERLGLSRSVRVAEQQGQVVEADRHVGMLRAKLFSLMASARLRKRLGLSQPVGGAEQPGQVVEASCHVGMLRAEALFING
jgi:head-tail adaptor